MAAIKCVCGARMACIDTRMSGADVRRRYKCKCGKRATTKETVVEMDDGPNPVGNQCRPRARLAVLKGTP